MIFAVAQCISKLNSSIKSGEHGQKTIKTEIFPVLHLYRTQALQKLHWCQRCNQG